VKHLGRYKMMHCEFQVPVSKIIISFNYYLTSLATEVLTEC
jgi:hypothetical protein